MIMAVPQFGDLVKFGELAWTVYQYGWSPELDASKLMLQFPKPPKWLKTWHAWLACDIKCQVKTQVGGLYYP